MTAVNVRKLSFGFFILLSVYCLIAGFYENIRHNFEYANALLIEAILLVSFALQFKFRIRYVDIILGGIALAGSLYLVLAILDDWFDWTSGIDHYKNPPLYFGFWFSLIAMMNIMSVLMIGAEKQTPRQDH
jgi:hypothetical protein